jgi:hypothetical protein
MKLLTKDGFIELINHPFTTEFSVLHLLNEGSFGSGYGRSPFIYPNLSFPEMNISTIWDYKA